MYEAARSAVSCAGVKGDWTRMSRSLSDRAPSRPVDEPAPAPSPGTPPRGTPGTVSIDERPSADFARPTPLREGESGGLRSSEGLPVGVIGRQVGERTVDQRRRLPAGGLVAHVRERADLELLQ